MILPSPNHLPEYLPESHPKITSQNHIPESHPRITSLDDAVVWPCEDEKIFRFCYPPIPLGRHLLSLSLSLSALAHTLIDPFEPRLSFAPQAPSSLVDFTT